MSRTSLSIKNSKVALLFYVIEIVLGFFSRKVFITYIGVEVLGLNTTANNLLQFLNLAELGIGSAVSFALYKPLSQNDIPKIKEIIQVQGWLYKKIAIFVSLGATILMLFFPLIFGKAELPLWYSYASFGVLLYGSLLTYFVNYKQILLSASQQDYKITYSYKSVILLKNVVQIIAIMSLSNGYVWWIVLQFVFCTLASINLNLTINRNFPFLKGLDTHIGYELIFKYKVIINKVKQLFFHKISGYILTQTSPLVIYAFASLTLVAIYGNYMLILSGVTMLLQSIFNGIAAGVGNLVSQGDEKRIITVFKELFTSRFFCAIVFVFCIYELADSFIVLWVGKDYLLDKSTLLLMLLIMFINLTRGVVDNFLFAYGLFNDIWAPIFEAIINLSLSIALGYIWGINGILLGVLISLIVVVLIWKPIFLFNNGFKKDIIIYIKLYLKHVLICLFSCIVANFLLSRIYMEVTDFISWGVKTMISFVIISLITYVLLYLCIFEMRLFTKRIISNIKK